MPSKITINTELNDKVTKKLNGISGAFDKLGGKGSGASLFGNVGAKAIAGGFNLIADAAGAAIGFLTDSVEAASNLEQQTGGLESVFGESAQSIKDWAETADSAFGLSKRAVFEAATVIGAKLQGMGFSAADAAAQTLILEERGADLAATFGGPTSDAIAAISSLLTGERDPIERYGVSIKEADVAARIMALGLDTSTVAAKKTAVATASLSLLLEQSAKASGQSARETDTLASKQGALNAKMENAQAVLGEKLMPLFIAFADFMVDVAIPAITVGINVVGSLASNFSKLGDMVLRASMLLDGYSHRVGHLPKTPPLIQTGTAPTPHAEGGWAGLRGPELALLGERGPEYVRKAGTGTGDGNGGWHGHPIIMDGRKVAEAVDERMYRKRALLPARAG